MQKKFFTSSGYTGHILEEEVLGSCSVKFDGFLIFPKAKEFARKNQPKVLCPTARAFREVVAKEMKVDPASVAIYTAVGSPLDTYHSVDGWFEWNGNTVTFDVTMNRQKDRYRADVTVVMGGCDMEYDLEFAAREIANAFKWAERGRKSHDLHV